MFDLYFCHSHVERVARKGSLLNVISHLVYQLSFLVRCCCATTFISFVHLRLFFDGINVQYFLLGIKDLFLFCCQRPSGLSNYNAGPKEMFHFSIRFIYTHAVAIDSCAQNWTVIRIDCSYTYFLCSCLTPYN